MWLLSFKTVILINILLLSLTVHYVLSTNLEPGDRAVNEMDKTACPGGADILEERWMANTKMNKR